jgi:aryl-alcohol dehydrogenase-like predicted oxidoreductase
VQVYEGVEMLKKLLGTEANTLPELGLRYVLSFSVVSTVIPGMRKLGHVRENL